MVDLVVGGIGAVGLALAATIAVWNGIGTDNFVAGTGRGRGTGRPAHQGLRVAWPRDAGHPGDRRGQPGVRGTQRDRHP